MKNYRFLIALVAVFMSYEVTNAQIGKHFRLYDLGFGVDMISQDGSSENLTLINGSFGVNLPILPINEEMSIGVSPSLTATFYGIASSGQTISSSDGFGNFQVFGATVPLLANFKYGTDASLKSKSDFGFTVGAGYRYNWLLDYTWGAPAVMGEVNAKLGFLGLLKLRYITDFGADVEGQSGKLNQQSIFLVVTPNW